MPSDFVNADGRTCIVLGHDEAAVVCGPDGIQLFLHKGPGGEVVESKHNLAATDMALMYGDFQNEFPFTEDPDGPPSNN